MPPPPQPATTVFLHSLPPSSTIGCDTLSFTLTRTTARQFKGIIDVPPGPHLVWVSGGGGGNGGNDDDMGMAGIMGGVRYGCWIWVPSGSDTRTTTNTSTTGTATAPAGTAAIEREQQPSKNYVHLKWDKEAEMLVPTTAPPSTATATKANDDRIGKEILVPYHTTTGGAGALREEPEEDALLDMPEFVTDFSPQRIWKEVVSGITPAVLGRSMGATFGGEKEEGKEGEERNKVGIWGPISTLDTVRGEFLDRRERELYERVGVGDTHKQKNGQSGSGSSGDSCCGNGVGGGGRCGIDGGVGMTFGELEFLFPQDRKTYSVSVTGRERTEQARDATGFILSLLSATSSSTPLSAHPSPSDRDDTDTDDDKENDDDNTKPQQPTPTISESDILADFNLTFLTAALLGNSSCAGQWWHLISHLVFRAYSLPVRNPLLARMMLRGMLAQLVFLEGCCDREGEDGGATPSAAPAAGGTATGASAAGGGGMGGMGALDGSIALGGGNLWDYPPPAPSSDGDGWHGGYSKDNLRRGMRVYRDRLEEQVQEGVLGHVGVRRAFEQLVGWLGWGALGLCRPGEGDTKGGEAIAEGSGGGGAREPGGRSGGPEYLREGLVVLEDGEEVRLRVRDDEGDKEDEEGDWAPVVVEVDEGGREVGMVSWD